MKKYTRKLRRISTHSYSTIIPKTLIQKYGWREKQKLILTDKGRGRVEIRDWKK